VGTEPRLTLESGNEYDISTQELEELANEIEAATSHLEVAVGHEEQVGAGVTLSEVLHVFLPSAEFVKDSMYTPVVGALVLFLRRRFKKRHEGQRKRVAILYGPDGAPLREVVVTRDVDGFTDTLASPDARTRRLPRLIDRGSS
jgi:hypothetical protein